MNFAPRTTSAICLESLFLGQFEAPRHSSNSSPSTSPPLRCMTNPSCCDGLSFQPAVAVRKSQRLPKLRLEVEQKPEKTAMVPEAGIEPNDFNPLEVREYATASACPFRSHQWNHYARRSLTVIASGRTLRTMSYICLITNEGGIYGHDQGWSVILAGRKRWRTSTRNHRWLPSRSSSRRAAHAGGGCLFLLSR